MAYLGSTPETQSFTSGTDYFNGDGISVAFTLSRPVASVNDIEVVISNVVQQPSTAYTVSGTTITFTSAPPAGTANVYARYLSTVTQTITPSPGTVGTSQLSPSLTNIPFFGGSTLGAGNATGMKNRIINGGMVIDQRNAGASVTGVTQYSVDRWKIVCNPASKFSAQQNADAVTPPTGFTNYLGITSSSAYSVSSSEYQAFSQVVEGYNVADLGWGTANAKTITVSFWARSSLTGTFGGSIRDAAGLRSYPFSYSISSANTWEKKAVVVTGDTTGTWLTTNGIGLVLYFGLGVGTTFSAAAGAWAAGNYLSTTGATSVVGTSGATFYITGVQLEEGNAATSFDFRDYGRELAMCQRYYTVVSSSTNSNLVGAYCRSSTVIEAFGTPMPVQMRTTPSLGTTGTLYFFNGTANANLSSISISASSTSQWSLTATISGGTAGTAGQIYGSTGNIQLSAEL